MTGLEDVGLEADKECPLCHGSGEVLDGVERNQLRAELAGARADIAAGAQLVTTWMDRANDMEAERDQLRAEVAEGRVERVREVCRNLAGKSTAVEQILAVLEVTP